MVQPAAMLLRGQEGLFRDTHHSSSPDNPFSTHSLLLILGEVGGHGNVGYGEDSGS